MNELAQQILRSGKFRDSDGNESPLHSYTNLEQCEFLVQQMRAVGARTTLEVGLAYGLSALFICDELSKTEGSKHYAIDPYQLTASWNGQGLLHLDRAGLREFCDFRDAPAQDVLPQLASEGVKLDFAYIDAGKRLDETLIYSYYLCQMIRVGGRIAYDDVCYPGIRKALRYLVQQDHLRVVDSCASNRASLKRRLAARVASLLPLPGKRHWLAPELQCSDEEMGLAADCVVLEKTREFEDDWKWHVAF